MTFKKTTYNEISVKNDHGAWARLLWEDNGRVIIISDFGHWSYWWGHRGSDSVAKFLAGLDSFYMGNKMLGTHFRNHSDQETVKAIRKFICDERRNGDMEKHKAREEWAIAECYEDGDYDYRGWIENTSICEPWDLGRTECSIDWTSFWDRLWVPLIKPQLTELVASATSSESKGEL